MPEVKDYQRALEIIATESIDYRKVAIELAKQNPLLFIRFATQPASLTYEARLQGIVDCIENGYKVEAIKAIRTRYDLPLKEAKDVCEVICGDLKEKGGGDRNGAPTKLSLFPSGRQAYDELITYMLAFGGWEE